MRCSSEGVGCLRRVEPQAVVEVRASELARQLLSDRWESDLRFLNFAENEMLLDEVSVCSLASCVSAACEWVCMLSVLVWVRRLCARVSG